MDVLQCTLGYTVYTDFVNWAALQKLPAVKDMTIAIIQHKYTIYERRSSFNRGSTCSVKYIME